MTRTERCRMMESSLPVAPYRATLTALHDEMLAEIEAKDALLRQALDVLDWIANTDAMPSEYRLAAQAPLTAIKERLA